MRRPLPALAILAGCAAVAACGIHRSKDAGPETSRTIAVGDFSSIEVAGPYDVRVRTGGKPGVSVKGPQNIVDQLVIEVEGNELRIHTKKNGMFRQALWSDHQPVAIEVTAATLDGAAIAGSGDVAVDQVKSAAFTGAVAGSGSLSIAALDVEKLKLEIAGSGNIDASGKASEAHYSIAGSGSINSPRVIAQDLKVSIAGSGDVAAHATGSADLDIVGSGDVTVTGGAKCKVSKMGSGNANCS